MLTAAVLLLALAVGQVPAKSTNLATVDFIENVKGGDSRIVSGWEATPGQHPHHCNLRMTNAAGQLFSCGGSVVHSNWVLTAAHCTATRVSIVVRAGLVFLNDALYIHETTEWYNHPTYVDEMAHLVQPNDISLIRLHQAIVFGEYVRPIRMQSRADAFRNYEGLMLYASGHGRTWTGGSTPDALQWVYLRGISNFNCQRVFGTALITDNSICAQYFNVTSQSTCHGDSGGPLVYEEDGVPTLIGVTSFVAGEASGGCHSGHPGGFIRPGPFHEWFLLITGFDFEFVDDDTTTTTTSTTTTTTTTTTKPTTTDSPTTTEPPTIKPEEPEGPEEPDCSEEDQSGESEEGPEEEESDESDDDSTDCDDNSDDDKPDCGLSELMKKMEVEVKVKVKLQKRGKKKVIKHHHNKTITHQRSH